MNNVTFLLSFSLMINPELFMKQFMSFAETCVLKLNLKFSVLTVVS